MAQINKPNTYFNTVLYSGDNTNNRTITGVGFDPDMVWVKSRSNAKAHLIADIVRGANKNIVPNETGGEFNPTSDVGSGGIGQVTTDGFTCVQGTVDLTNTNASGYTYASWSWKGGGTASSNTDGSITSSVSANTTSGFSIVKYNGNGTGGATVGHGLGVAPKAVIVKAITAGNTQNWFLNYPFGTGTGYLMLNLTNAGSGANNTVWNSTAPTSSYVTIGTSNGVNSASYEYIMYCFAEKKGFSKFGSYVGNGSADGTFVYTGFKPAMVIIKNASSVTDWALKDNKRGTYNVVGPILYPNGSYAEDASGALLDFTSNGFKLRISGVSAPNVNESGSTFIYMAFAENPLVGTNNIPTTAR